MRALVMAVTMTTSTAALPCSFFVPGTLNGAYSVEDRTVPPNAELRTDAAFNDADAVLVRPDGTRETLAFVVDSVGPRWLALDVLAEGSHTIELRVQGQPEDEAAQRVVGFEVAGDEDVDPPDAPLVTATRETGGELPVIGSMCSGAQYPTDFVTLEVELDDDAAAYGLVGGPRQVRRTDDRGVIFLQEPRGGDIDYDVVVRDFAGNESAPTTASVWGGCEGGCSSSSSLPIAGALLLLLRRRRRSLRA